jgi:transcriptional regulator with GAF, ATPase, and Fis domain
VVYYLAETFAGVPYLMNEEEAAVGLLILVAWVVFAAAVTVEHTSRSVRHMNEAVESTLSAEKAVDYTVVDVTSDGTALKMINGLQRYFMNAETRDEVLDRLMVSLSRVLKVARVSIMLFDERRQELFVHRTLGWSPRELKLIRKSRTKPGEGIAGRVFLDNSPIVVNRNDDSEIGGSRNRAGSYVSYPLKGRDRIIGVVNLTDKEEQTFSEQELDLLSFLLNETSMRLAGM